MGVCQRWVRLNRANTRITGSRVIAELKQHSPNPAPRARMIRMVLQHGAVRVERKLQMCLTEKSQSQVQPRTLERCIIADCAPEAVGCLANVAPAPEQRA